MTGLWPILNKYALVQRILSQPPHLAKDVSLHMLSRGEAVWMGQARRQPIRRKRP
jgi:hypothetical protein